MWGRSFHRGFVGIPTDLSSDPSICGVGYVREQHFSFLFAQTFLGRTHVKKRKNGNFGNFSFNKKLNFERIWFLLPDG
ncbi:hypothetical protein LEP1GSC036_0683 [Leptospira weilii str. 2006001853]|uniref:Uncharacterized protein n=1 Tax=Leptospira weilii str. 2006001853 TaxID=1001589 RepID=A0A828Z6P4_9LEPT|nr:hypothetical protein LEP1GSC036_0683 [Leptospira weilii str. 2006001853]EMN46693.1 hypothetical protein LEP1GSC086_4157 [Leptospira weilii str. LNT 1234]